MGPKMISLLDLVFICQPRKKTILVCVCGRYQTGWQKQNINPPHGKILMKDVDLGETTSFLDHVHLECTQRECKISCEIVANYRDTFESRISAGAKENYLAEFQGNLMQKQFLGPWTWKVTQRNVWKDVVNLRIKRLNHHKKSQHHAWVSIN